jgi:hypothetical protein
MLSDDTLGRWRPEGWSDWVASGGKPNQTRTPDGWERWIRDAMATMISVGEGVGWWWFASLTAPDPTGLWLSVSRPVSTL